MKFLLVLFLCVGAAGFFLFNVSLGVFNDLFFVDKAEELFQGIVERQVVADFFLQELERKISIPPPLRALDEALGGQDELAPSVSLSVKEVFLWTNVHRQDNGLSPLQGSLLLNEIALRKVQDMFANQYFAHISLVEIGISDLAEDAGYEFLASGENLALGNYEDSQALVQAWMDSPGHRENILGARYEEIGIALQQGDFEGNSTWLAVQVFALPISACDFPSETLKEEIALGKIQIEELTFILAQMREELGTPQQKPRSSYNRKVAAYNTLVEQYNKLAQEVQGKTSRYNIEVQTFNACARQ